MPVLGLSAGERIVVIASGYGESSRRTGLYHNLRANPEARVVVRGAERRVEAEGDERDRLWREGLKIYPGFAGYQQRVAEQSIPVMVLSPLE